MSSVEPIESIITSIMELCSAVSMDPAIGSDMEKRDFNKMKTKPHKDANRSQVELLCSQYELFFERFCKVCVVFCYGHGIVKYLTITVECNILTKHRLVFGGPFNSCRKKESNSRTNA